jgi:predicted TIM-barrel fold metal-dependent hydrolase
MKYIDCDSHILPLDVYRHVRPEFQSRLPKFHFDKDQRLIDVEVSVDPVKHTLNTNPFSFHNQVSGISNVSKRIQDLNTMGWNKQLLNPQELALRFNYSVDPELAGEMARSYNLVMAELLAENTEHFFGVALIPLQNYQASIEQIDFAVAHGFRGIYLDMMYLDNQSNLSRPIETIDYVGELYYTCQEHGLVVYRHHMMHHTHFRRHPHFRSISQFLPHDIELAMYSSICSGEFERFPELQMVFAEDVEPYAVTAIQNLQKIWADDNTGSCFKKDPTEYWNKNISVTLDIEKIESFENLMNLIGSERLLLSSDYPHDDKAGKNKWHDIFDFNNLLLHSSDRENIAYRNAQKLFRV